MSRVAGTVLGLALLLAVGTGVVALSNLDSDGSGVGPGEDIGERKPSRMVVGPDSLEFRVQVRGVQAANFRSPPGQLLLVRDLGAAGEGTDGLRRELEIAWLPFSLPGNRLALAVKPVTNALPCRFPSEVGTSDRCFQVSIREDPTGAMGSLAVGSYHSVILLSDGREILAEVPVTLLLRRPFWQLVVTILLGILATELYLWLRDVGRYRYRWRYLRSRWLGWQTHDTDWIRPFAGQAAQEGEWRVLKALQREVRSVLEALDGQLAGLAAGEILITDLPDSPEAVREALRPLYDFGWTCLEPSRQRPWRNGVAAIEEAMQVLLETITAVFRVGVEQAFAQLESPFVKIEEELEQAYRVLEGVLVGRKDLGNEILRDAATEAPRLMGMFRESREKLVELQRELSSTLEPSERPQLVILEELAVEGRALVNTVLELGPLVNTHHEALCRLPTTLPGGTEAKRVCGLLLRFAGDPLFIMAEERLREISNPFHPPVEPRLTQVMHEIGDRLNGLYSQVDTLQVIHLGRDAWLRLLADPLRKELARVEAELGAEGATLTAQWPRITAAFQRQLRRVRLGKRLRRSYRRLPYRWRRGSDNRVVQKLFESYQALLDSRLLDAELALERAQRLRAEPLLPEEVAEGLARKPSDRNRLRTLWLRLRPQLMIMSLMIMMVVVGAMLWVRRPEVADSEGAGGTPSLVVMMLLTAAMMVLMMSLMAGPMARGIRFLRFRFPVLLAGAVTEMGVTLGYLLSSSSSWLLSLVIALAVILAAQQALQASLDTWGSLLDLVTAFAWGAVAHRLLQALRSGHRLLDDFLGSM